MMMSKAVLALGLGAFMFAVTPVSARAASAIAAPALPTAAQALPGVIPTADGCGWGYYRGPYGYCHAFGTGPYPAGYYNNYAPPPAVAYNASGCPVGYWRGPWGNCRDTPYVGRLPDGGYQY